MKDDCITQILIASLIHGSIKGWEKKVFELGSESLNTGRGEAGGGGKGREGGRGEGDRAFQIPTNRPLTGQLVPHTGDDGDRLLVERFRLVGTLFLCDPGKQEEVLYHRAISRTKMQEAKEHRARQVFLHDTPKTAWLPSTDELTHQTTAAVLLSWRTACPGWLPRLPTNL